MVLGFVGYRRWLWTSTVTDDGFWASLVADDGLGASTVTTCFILNAVFLNKVLIFQQPSILSQKKTDREERQRKSVRFTKVCHVQYYYLKSLTALLAKSGCGLSYNTKEK
jgi:adenine specific DNA methylase Mod